LILAIKAQYHGEKKEYLLTIAKSASALRSCSFRT
jgi:hypothetical protein